MRKIALLTHEWRQDALERARSAKERLGKAGITVVDATCSSDVADAELLLMAGGDGTILRGAEFTRGTKVPILGINFGHVGFLAEAEPSSMDEVVTAVIEHQWTVEDRMTLDLDITLENGEVIHDWAVNEASIEKAHGARTINLGIGVDGRGLSTYNADAALISTPTGSTAYNFSAQGPVVWPDVEAMIFNPIAAHALFTRPLVVGPNSVIQVQVYSRDAIIWCDGRRPVDVVGGAQIEARHSSERVYLARLNDSPFSSRLVRKFHLPVAGWRKRGADD
ncbi:NAD kinase [Arcanobacterium wilhelmae]|uniref:NAD kinase n=1 Tax=Arcanobacterium wilhelmae TaxID=1803177 RepID=UPI00241568EE|nr:NAD kinase [Arcanobacterium wilhelmae]WFN91066.1 NAD kinase [Arcanobacterium wilhelmae]